MRRLHRHTAEPIKGRGSRGAQRRKGDEINYPLAHEFGVRHARLLTAVFAQAGVGIGISDVTGKILAVNTAFAAMFGYDDVEEFITKFNITDLTHPDDTPEVWNRYAELTCGDVDRMCVEKPHLHRDGHTILE